MRRGCEGPGDGVDTRGSTPAAEDAEAREELDWLDGKVTGSAGRVVDEIGGVGVEVGVLVETLDVVRSIQEIICSDRRVSAFSRDEDGSSRWQMGHSSSSRIWGVRGKGRIRKSSPGTACRLPAVEVGASNAFCKLGDGP